MHISFEEDDGKITSPVNKDHTRAVEPRKNVENIRLNEFIVLLVGDNSSRGIKLHENHGMKLEESVTTKFPETNENNEVNSELTRDRLEECMHDVFSSLNEISDDENDSVSDIETPSTISDIDHSTVKRVHRFSTSNIFDIAKDHLEKKSSQILPMTTNQNLHVNYVDLNQKAKLKTWP